MQVLAPDLSRNFELDDERMYSRFSDVFGGVTQFLSPQDLAGITLHVVCASVRKRVLNFVCRQRVDQVLRVPVHTMTLTRRDAGPEDTNSVILEPDAELVRINNHCSPVSGYLPSLSPNRLGHCKLSVNLRPQVLPKHVLLVRRSLPNMPPSNVST